MMNEDEERLQVSVDVLAGQLHELVMVVGGINAYLIARAAESGEHRTLLDDFQAQLRALRTNAENAREALSEESS